MTPIFWMCVVDTLNQFNVHVVNHPASLFESRLTVDLRWRLATLNFHGKHLKKNKNPLKKSNFLQKAHLTEKVIDFIKESLRFWKHTKTPKSSKNYILSKTTKKQLILLRNPYGFEKHTKSQETPWKSILFHKIIKKLIDFIKESLRFWKTCIKCIKIQETSRKSWFCSTFLKINHRFY